MLFIHIYLYCVYLFIFFFYLVNVTKNELFHIISHVHIHIRYSSFYFNPFDITNDMNIRLTITCC